MIAAREVARRRRSRAARRGAADPADDGVDRRSGTPIAPVSATATAAGSTPSASAAASRIASASPVALLAGGGVGVAELTTAARIARGVALARGRPAPARRRRRCGSAAAPSAPRRRRRRARPTSVAPPPLSPQATPGGPEPGRQLGRVELLDPGRRRSPSASGRSCVRPTLIADPSVSGSPSIRFRFWIACAGGPLPEVVDRGEGQHPAAPRRGATWTRQRLVSRTSRTPGRLVDQLDERLVGVALP